MVIAYIVGTPVRYLNCRPCCSVIESREYFEMVPFQNINNFFLRDCFDSTRMSTTQIFYLCEKDIVNSTTRKKSHLHLPSLNTNVKELMPPAFPCQAGHFTHCFLAIDRRASCLERASSFLQEPAVFHKDLCSRGVTLMPYHFVCSRNWEYLSYTLVCDRHQDCWDNSDEDFCVFPSCTDSSQSRCVNSPQVRQHKSFAFRILYLLLVSLLLSLSLLKGRHGSGNKGSFESGQNKSKTC